jgi:tellurite resistance protein TerC
MQTIGEWWMWAGFGVFVVVAVLVDLLLMRQQGPHKVSVKEASIWTLIWIALALIFAGLLWWYLKGAVGIEAANVRVSEFLTGYLIEKSLSVDNIFVFLMLFTYFAVPVEYQKRVIILGIVGAIVLRAIMILLGGLLIAKFHWILYFFGLFLLVTGVKMLWFADATPDLEKNPVLRWMRGHLAISRDFRGEQFSFMEAGKRWFTPLFVVVILVAVTDIIFAVDSIPAIYAVTDDPFVVMTANIFAFLDFERCTFCWPT